MATAVGDWMTIPQLGLGRGAPLLETLAGLWEGLIIPNPHQPILQEEPTPGH